MSRPPTSVVSFHYIVCLLLGLSTSCAAPQAQPGVLPTEREAAPSSPSLPLDPKVTTGALDYGLTYFLELHKTQDKRAHLVLVVKAGSLYEEDDQRGLAHFVEHMA